MYLELFEKHAELLKALAHPRRLEIIHLLRDQELPVNDIHTMLDLPQANISQHLMVLRESGIVNTRRDGKQIYYSLSSTNFIKASDLLREVLIDKLNNPQFSQNAELKMKDLVPLVHDPVCNMRVSPKTAGFSHTHDHQTFYFCASGCLKKFIMKPEQYAIN
ncbi:MAG: metalloregulator ArsR/SmtB family transcription factor [Patescibacteria group bacterium]